MTQSRDYYNCLKMTSFNLTSIVLCLFLITIGHGFDFTIDRREYLVKNQTYCGLLQCQVDTASDTNMASLIKMDIYYLKNEKLLASMLPENSEIQTHTGNNTKVIGSMSKDHGEFHVYFSDVSICSETAFICKIHYNNSTHEKEIEEKVILPLNSNQSEADMYVKSHISIEQKIFDKTGAVMKRLTSQNSLTNDGTEFYFTLGNPYLINRDEVSMQRKRTPTILRENAENNFEQHISDLEGRLRTQLESFINQMSSKMEGIQFTPKKTSTQFNEPNQKDIIGKFRQVMSAILESNVDTKLSNLDSRVEDLIDQVNISLNELKKGVHDNDKCNDLRNKTDQTLCGLLENLEELRIHQRPLMALLVNLTTTLNVHGMEPRPDEYKAFGDNQSQEHLLKCEKGMTSLHCSRVITLLDNKKQVLCDTETDGGGWIIIQRRVNGQVNFTRNWNDYKNGFGSLDGDFWIGNELISNITSKDAYTLRIDMRERRNVYNVEYDSFMLKNESDNYRLHLGVFKGSIANSFSHHNNMAFSTPDRDNDISWKVNCAAFHKSGWWFSNCFNTNLNGLWGFTDNGISWYGFHISNFMIMDFVEMKIRLK